MVAGSIPRGRWDPKAIQHALSPRGEVARLWVRAGRSPSFLARVGQHSRCGLHVDSIGLLFFQHAHRHIARANTRNALKPVTAFSTRRSAQTGLARTHHQHDRLIPSTTRKTPLCSNRQPVARIYSYNRRAARAKTRVRRLIEQLPLRFPHHLRVGRSRSPDNLPSQRVRMLIPHRRQQRRPAAHSSRLFVGMLVSIMQ